MIRHVTINVKDFPKSKDFYTKVLASLGLEITHEDKDVWCGFGVDSVQFGIGVVDDTHPLTQGVHIAFVASNKEEVEKFHAEALKAGGTDNGVPGYRKNYAAGYYAAFVIDPDGHNIEVVFSDPNPTE